MHLNQRVKLSPVFKSVILSSGFPVDVYDKVIREDYTGLVVSDNAGLAVVRFVDGAYALPARTLIEVPFEEGEDVLHEQRLATISVDDGSESLRYNISFENGGEDDWVDAEELTIDSTEYVEGQTVIVAGVEDTVEHVDYTDRTLPYRLASIGYVYPNEISVLDFPPQVEEDLLFRLLNSSLNLLSRFDVVPGRENTMQVFDEELGEFRTALGAIWGGNSGEKSLRELGDELADLIVTALLRATAAGLTREQLVNSIEYVISKNDAKTNRTHTLKNGKISRR